MASFSDTKLIKMNSQHDHRQLIVLSAPQDKQAVCEQFALTITQNLDCLNLENPKKSNDYLGQEFDAVIFNGFDSIESSFDPNALGAVAGTIRAGGYFILLKPNNWAKKSLFLSRFESLLNAAKGVLFVDINNKPKVLPSIARNVKAKTINHDQQQAIDAIIKVVKGHRRRPLVITADRGRGKSASLGIASADLLKNGLSTIIVTAPSKKSAEIIFKHAKENYPDAKLHFYSPDELQQQKPVADLLLVDEAGAIPLYLLEDFLQYYSRIVFATTLHGYEGSGRGFTLKFLKTLDAFTPSWKHYQLTSPIRYAENDPLENFIFNSLLLNAEAVKADLIKQAKLEDCHVKLLDKDELINDEYLLNSVFGLLVNAHYQTKPSDLKLMLDESTLRIFVLLTPQQQVVGVALIIKEGGLEAELATQIYQGQRRIKGHLVAQALAANVGIEFAPCLTASRISRIAIHPQLQNHGFGSYLLNMICENESTDYVSTSFGAATELISFWKTQGFISVYLGMKRDASSGTHSLIMLKGRSKKGKETVEDAQLRFSKSYIVLLSDSFKNLESQLALFLLSDIDTTTLPLLNKKEEQELMAFGKYLRGYENTLYPILTFIEKNLPMGQSKLNPVENKVILHKLLQKQSWEVTKNKTGLSGKKEVLQFLRQAITKLASGNL